MKNGATFIIGGQYGDEGKGLISGYISLRDNAKIVCKGGVGPNAEHGIFTSDTNYLKVNQLPLGWIFNPNTQIKIGSGVVLDPVKFFYECEKYNLLDRVKVDYRCSILTQEHMNAERNSKHINNISSTFSGSGFCKADFVLRKAKQARDIPELENYITDVALEINNVAKEYLVTIESSQGTFLSLAISSDYPNTTSDNVTTCAVADDVLLNWQHIKDVILCIKTMPSREGIGSMGSRELSLEEIKDKGLVEISSIGGVVRRKAESINFELLKYACMVNGATQIALTFCEHYDPSINNITSIADISYKLWELIHKVEDNTNIPVTILNTGKHYLSIIDLTGEKVDWEKVKNNLSVYKERI